MTKIKVKVTETGEINIFHLKVIGENKADNLKEQEINLTKLKQLLEPNKKTLEELLEEWSVMSPGMWENDLTASPLIGDWYTVANDNGIIAYFGEEKDAFAFRLNKINQILNG